MGPESRSLEDVEARNAMLSLAVAATNLGTWDVDAATGAATLSARCREILGFAPGQPVAMLDFYDCLVPDDREQIRLAFEDALDPVLRATYDVEYRIVGRADGLERWVAAQGRGVFDIGGACVRATGVVMDITARKRTETALRQLTETLEARVREEVAAREEAQARLAKAQRLEALGQLAGGIAHDFNNVLQAVAGGARLIPLRLDRPELVRRICEMMVESAGRGATITNRLLAFARHSALSAQSIETAELLSGLREELARRLGPAVTLRLDQPAERATVLADRGQLEIVLMDLIANARDAMPDGGTVSIKISIEMAGQDGQPADLKPGPYVRFVITDTGSGMDPSTLERIAEPFFTTKPVGKGTGLGLAMARGFAQQSGGALRVDSVVNVGTTATLWLPGAPGQLSPNLSGTVYPADGRALIMVVDDDPIVRDVLTALLQDHGHATIDAASGAAALEVLRGETAVDLLLTDLAMPGMDGLTLLREARNERPALPAILLTGYAGDTTALASSRGTAGGFTLLRKPISGEELAGRVGALLAGRSSAAPP